MQQGLKELKNKIIAGSVHVLMDCYFLTAAISIVYKTPAVLKIRDHFMINILCISWWQYAAYGRYLKFKFLPVFGPHLVPPEAFNQAP